MFIQESKAFRDLNWHYSYSL